MPDTVAVPLSPEQQQLVKQWLPLAYRLAFQARLRFGLPDADDLLSEALLRLVMSARAYDPRRSCKFSTYAFCAITRGLRDFARKLLRDRGRCRAIGDALDLVAAPEDEASRARPDLDRALARLPPREREVLRLRYLSGLTMVAAGAALHCSKERVRQLTNSGLARLRLYVG